MDSASCSKGSYFFRVHYNFIVSVLKSNEIRKKEIHISPTFSYNLRGFQVDPGWLLRQPKKFSPTSNGAVDKMLIRSDHKIRQKRRRIINYVAFLNLYERLHPHFVYSDFRSIFQKPNSSDFFI